MHWEHWVYSALVKYLPKKCRYTIKWEEFLLGANGNETKSDEMSSLQKKHCENASPVDEWSNEVKWWNGF